MADRRLILAKLMHFGRYLAGWLFILTSAIWLTVHAIWLYWLTLKTTDVLQQVNLSQATMMHNYRQLLAYLDFPWVTKLAMADFSDSKAGLQHFADVKHLLMLNNVILIITMFITGWGLWRLLRQRRLWQLQLPMQIALPIAPILAVIMSMNFNQFFITFHEILFRNDDWLFDPNRDPIIDALPASFFLNCFVLFFVIFEGWLVVGWLVGRQAAKSI